MLRGTGNMLQTARCEGLFTLMKAACACAVLALASPQPNAEAQAKLTTPTPATSKPTPSKAALPPGALEVNLVDIIDRQGFERPMVAAKVLIPKGWRTEGEVWWNRSAPPGCAAPADFAWATVSPDGLSRVELLPTELWTASNSLQSQCRYGEFQDMQSYLNAYIQNRFPGARITGYKPRPDFLELQRDYVQAMVQMVNTSGTGMRAWADAGEMTYTTRQNGTEIDGFVGATAMFFMGQSYNPLGGPPLVNLSAQTTSAFGASGPKGKFDRRIAEAVRKSIKTENEWGQKYTELLARISSVQTQGVKDRAAIIVAAGAAMTANTVARNKAAGERAVNAVKNSFASPSSSRSNEDTEDRMQRERIEGVRGVETYDDPVYGGTVQLDNTYDHAWRVNNNDSYILTNDPNFNPGLYNIDAQQLKVTR